MFKKMRLFLITVSLALASAVPAYNYQPQHLHTNTLGPINNQGSSTQGHQFLQNALQNSPAFLGHGASSSNQNLQQQSSNFNNGQLFAPANNQFSQQQQQFNYQFLAPIVSKDIYVHVPPEEPEENYQVPQAPIQPPRKHYRIVFIKAPTQKINTASLRITQAPTEEKTIIYVLSKKQDPLDLEAVFKNVAPTQPSKPEVFFIKYKTQEEAVHAQQSIQAQYDKLGGTSEYSDEGIAPVTSVIGSLQNQQSSSIGSFSNGHNDDESSSSLSSYLPPSH
ncbi:uncharacterized protein LOC129916205 [Episyrphus balteatus]|uniref:uncharacterized protein LOC129916205 n=1 Tax=Episyrphus balteatus TaxID=286459 RepID=UPI002486676A|nr:uncharacterized protein LOC129916205 [Episyrphus balteatus]